MCAVLMPNCSHSKLQSVEMATVRRITSADVDAIMMLQAATPEAPQWDRAVYEGIAAPITHRAASRIAWAAVNAEELLGYAVAHLTADVSELESIAVAKSARRAGIGRDLLKEVIEWSTASGAQKIELEVRSANSSAVAFYESAGFVFEGLRRRYYREPEDDAILMGKSLYSGD